MKIKRSKLVIFKLPLSNNDIGSIKDFLYQIVDDDMEEEMSKEAQKLMMCLDAFVEVILKLELQDGIKMGHGMH